MRGALALALIAWGGAVRAQAPQPAVVLSEPGPGGGPRLLRDVLSLPYRLVAPAAVPYVVRRDSTVRGPLLVLGRDAVVDGTVDGDVIVVHGDLYTHPGSRVTGGAVVYGGGIYESALGAVDGSRTAFREFTYDIAPAAGGYDLRYRRLYVDAPRTLAWAGPLGAGLPAYDRADGLSLPAVARFSPRGSGVEIAPEVTYRSELGAFDPSIAATARWSGGTGVRVGAEHGTFTNDAWIRADLANSAGALVLGDDARNYFRATRVETALSWPWRLGAARLTPGVGARWERASSVRPDSSAAGGPWSLFGRHSPEHMLRPNPPIDGGDIASLLGSAQLDWNGGGVTSSTRVELEVARASRAAGSAGSDAFAQATLDARVSFATFGAQQLRTRVHAVLTTPGTTPRQRFAYLGGPGTLTTVDMLARGGDELLYLSAAYDIPLTMVSLPLIGSPVLTLRDAIGGAGVRTVSTLSQAIGPRLSVGALYVEVMIDPVTRHTAAAAGLSLTR